MFFFCLEQLTAPKCDSNKCGRKCNLRMLQLQNQTPSLLLLSLMATHNPAGTFRDVLTNVQAFITLGLKNVRYDCRSGLSWLWCSSEVES